MAVDEEAVQRETGELPDQWAITGREYRPGDLPWSTPVSMNSVHVRIIKDSGEKNKRFCTSGQKSAQAVRKND